MAASPTAVTSPNTEGGNVLAALLAAAAASMHRQQQQQQQQSQASVINNNNNNNNNNTSSISIISNSNCSNSSFLNDIINNSSSSINSNSKHVQDADVGEMRILESWCDEDEKPIDESCYQELVDPSNSSGWSADDMFKYNEKMHKITSSYNSKTLSGNYTMPLPKTNSKATIRLAAQLAKEIEEKVLAEGRLTPESSDDDELFENERLQRVQQKQKRQLDQFKNLQRQSQHRFSMMNNNTTSTTKTTQSSSQYSNSTETPATASLSSSPTLNETIIKPVTSSSRNILRTCLT